MAYWNILARGVACASLMIASIASAQDQLIDPNTVRPSLEPGRTVNGLALTPPMGWNSWNKYGCNINETVIRQMANAMATNGMKDAGYIYIVIDDCWHGTRDAKGFITEDRAKFPSGLKALGDYIHARGLKFGIYSDAGRKTCGGRPGSQGHEFQDAQTYAGWGVDYLKYDWCSTGVRNAEEAYALMADALRATSRSIVFSICEWGNNHPWEWAQKIGNLWRTTGDIRDAWAGRVTYSMGIMDIVDKNEPLYPYAGPGHWNDPDMLEIGNGGLDDEESRAHFSLWAMMAAPLIAGNDIATMNGATRAILLNKEVIAVDQDSLGQQGRRVGKDGDQEVWSRQLADGGRAGWPTPGMRSASTGSIPALRSMRATWAPRLLDLAGTRIALMDETGLDVQVLSLTTPALHDLGSESVAIARRINDAVATTVARHPDRFQAFAALPVSQPEEAARELERCVRDFGFKGMMLCGRVETHNLDHPFLGPILESAATLGVPVFLHPRIPDLAVRDTYYSGFTPEVDAMFATAGLGWHYDAGIQFVRLVLAGTFDRLPGLQVILGHWGEVVLFFAERLAAMDRVTGLQHPIATYLRRNLYVTTSGMFWPHYLERAVATVGADRLLFSTDYPYQYRPGREARTFLETSGLTDAEKAGFAHANWERLTASNLR